MKLYFRKYGEGPPLVILHGLFGLSDNWVTIGRRLAEKFAVYIPDQRNHGQSPHSSAFSYFALTDDLFEFFEDHGLMEATLIGHSMGGKVAMQFALSNPHRVNRLIVVDIGMKKYPMREEHIAILNGMLSVDFDHVKTRADVANILSGHIRSEAIVQIILKNLYRIAKGRLAWRINAQAISDNLENILEGIESPYTFNKPALFVKGGRSDYILQEDESEIRKSFPMGGFHTISNASHWIHSEAPDELCAVFSHFLSKDCVFRI